jgi:hypothetical protein
MKRIAYVAVSFAAVLLIGLVPVLSQDGMGESGAEGEIDMEKAWMELHTPGEQHKWLAEDVGQWEITGKMYKMNSDGTTTTSEAKGSATISMLYDRYAQEEMTIECNGQTMRMSGILGYDNSNKEFQCCYVGNMGTAMHVYAGQLSEDGKTMTLRGEWTEKGLGDMKCAERVVFTRKSKDEGTLELHAKYGPMDEFKMMEMTYKRKK